MKRRLPTSAVLGAAIGSCVVVWPAIVAAVPDIRSPESAVSLIITANIRGELEPCGCQAIQDGGMASMASLISSLRGSSKNAVVIDCGNLVSPLAPNPELLTRSQEILRLMGVSAGAIGQGEMEWFKAGGGRYAKQKALLLPLVLTSPARGEGPVVKSSLELGGGKLSQVTLFCVHAGELEGDARAIADASTVASRRARGNARGFKAIVSYLRPGATQFWGS